jgi:2-dehydropantoate 2-reductase
MHIYLIGNGVIAKALAVSLQLNNRHVTILRGSVDEHPVTSELIRLEVGNDLLQAVINVSTISNYDKLDGLILLTTKTFGNKTIAGKLRGKAGTSPVVLLQNGLHIESSFIDFPELYRCALFATSQFGDEGNVRFKLVAPSPIGVINGSGETLQTIVAEITTPIFPFRVETDIQPIVWKKAICNCVFNSICPLLEIDNGVFHRNAAALELAKQVITECLAVALQHNINLSFDDVLNNLLSLSKMSDGQKISTYQDILNKRETEIDTLNFAIARAAGDLPVPATALLGKLAKLKSELSRL